MAPLSRPDFSERLQPSMAVDGDTWRTGTAVGAAHNSVWPCPDTFPGVPYPRVPYPRQQVMEIFERNVPRPPQLKFKGGDDPALVFTFSHAAKAHLTLRLRTVARLAHGQDVAAAPAAGPALPVEDIGRLPGAPRAWLKDFAAAFPVGEDDALCLEFTASPGHVFAVRLGAGNINALTGLAWDKNFEDVAGTLRVEGTVRLDGFAVAPGVVRQFVARFLKNADTVEAHLTGAATMGNLQLAVAPEQSLAPDVDRHHTLVQRPQRDYWRDFMDMVERMPPQIQPYVTYCATAAPVHGLPQNSLSCSVGGDKMGLGAGAALVGSLPVPAVQDRFNAASVFTCALRLVEADQWGDLLRAPVAAGAKNIGFLPPL